jgi:hypothetical protein
LSHSTFEHIELAYLVAEGDGAIAGHHNHPSTSNALHLRRCRFYVFLFSRHRRLQ